jgi:Mn-dependent DtxR family transcriptional regulator
MERVPTRIEILEFIRNRQFIQPWELADRFGYTHKFAKLKVHRLYRAGLIGNTVRGKWNLTYKGLRRLEYLTGKGSQKPQRKYRQ